jgi:hypothetical protein
MRHRTSFVFASIIVFANSKNESSSESCYLGSSARANRRAKREAIRAEPIWRRRLRRSKRARPEPDLPRSCLRCCAAIGLSRRAHNTGPAPPPAQPQVDVSEPPGLPGTSQDIRDLRRGWRREPRPGDTCRGRRASRLGHRISEARCGGSCAPGAATTAVWTPPGGRSCALRRKDYWPATSSLSTRSSSNACTYCSSWR